MVNKDYHSTKIYRVVVELSKFAHGMFMPHHPVGYALHARTTFRSIITTVLGYIYVASPNYRENLTGAIYRPRINTSTFITARRSSVCVRRL